MILAAVGMQREARLVERRGAGIGVRAVAGGGRAELLQARLEAAVEGAEAILSIGIGGALDPSLEVGDVVVGSEVLRPRRRWETDWAWRNFMLKSLPGARLGAIYGSDEMVLSALDKAKLRRQGGAMLVDMESHVAAKVAAERGLPLGVLRVVSDNANTSLPDAVRAGLAEDGGMNLIGVLSALASDPRQLPALMHVGRDADRALKALDKAAARVLARP